MVKILVVDDEPHIFHRIKRYAEHLGYETMGPTKVPIRLRCAVKNNYRILFAAYKENAQRNPADGAP